MIIIKLIQQKIFKHLGTQLLAVFLQCRFYKIGVNVAIFLCFHPDLHQGLTSIKI